MYILLGIIGILIVIIVFRKSIFLRLSKYPCAKCNKKFSYSEALSKLTLLNQKLYCTECLPKTNQTKETQSHKLEKIQESYNLSGKEFKRKDAEYASSLNKKVLIKYRNRDGKISERKIAIYYAEYGYFYGVDENSNEPRTFKLDRVEEWKITEDIFNKDPDIAAYLREHRDLGMNIAPSTYEKWKEWGGKNWA